MSGLGRVRQAQRGLTEEFQAVKTGNFSLSYGGIAFADFRICLWLVDNGKHTLTLSQLSMVDPQAAPREAGFVCAVDCDGYDAVGVGLRVLRWTRKGERITELVGELQGQDVFVNGLIAEFMKLPDYVPPPPPTPTTMHPSKVVFTPASKPEVPEREPMSVEFKKVETNGKKPLFAGKQKARKVLRWRN